MKNILTTMFLAFLTATVYAEKVNIVLSPKASNRVEYAAEYLQKHLQRQGFTVSGTPKRDNKADHTVTLAVAAGEGLKKEGFTLTADVKETRKGKKTEINILGNDGTGCI